MAERGLNGTAVGRPRTAAVAPVRTVSAIMVNYNGGRFLGESVRRLLASDDALEVIIVDNGSTDTSLDAVRVLRDDGGAITLIELGENVGFGAAVNVAATHATGRWMLLLNPDCFVRDQTVEQLRSALETLADAGIAGPLVFDTAGVEQRGARRHEPTPARALARALGRRSTRAGETAGYDLNSTPLPDEPVAVDAVSGSCMMLSRQVFDELGGMDEDFFLHCEDLDLCRRVRDLGLKVMFIPHVSVIHVQGVSGMNQQVEKYKHSSMVRYFEKHHAASTPAWQGVLLKAGVWLRFAAVVTLARLRPVSLRGEDEEIDRINLLLDPVPDASVIVTGASSFLAEPVVDQLQAYDLNVVAASRQVPRHLAPGTRWISFDYFSKIDADEFGEVAALVHLAPLWVLAAHIDGFLDKGIRRIVAVGSSSVQTKRGSTNTGEQAVVAKLASAETAIVAACRARGAEVTVIHPTMIYDPKARDHNVGRLVRFVRRFRVLPVVDPAPGLRQPIHADDLATLCVSALGTPPPEDNRMFVGGGETLSYRAMMERIASTAQPKGRLVVVPAGVFRLALELVGRLPFGPDLNGAMVDRFSEDLCFTNDEARERYRFEPGDFRPPGRAEKP